MEHDASKLVGICGLYCGTCPSYLAFRKKDMEKIEMMSLEKGLDFQELQCDGCLSGRVASGCRTCRHGFRTCAAEKQVKWCFECDEFPCQRLEDFEHVHVVNGVSHHINVINDLHYMKKYGIEDWVRVQDMEARCPGCGEVLYWFDRECPDCHEKVSR